MNVPVFGQESIHSSTGIQLEFWMLESWEKGGENSVNKSSLQHNNFQKEETMYPLAYRWKNYT